ncbi:hypothetical protein [Glutamicibacter ardleyensis]|uniref:hypothetical protein n=1 Tax=Glutamicibacter ardleyensis TaxID=225894 RepID=UPI003F901DAA
MALSYITFMYSTVYPKVVSDTVLSENWIWQEIGVHNEAESMANIRRVVAGHHRQLGFIQPQMAIELRITQRDVSELENGKISRLNTRALDFRDQLGIKFGFKVNEN